jgi:hypothetical protein
MDKGVAEPEGVQPGRLVREGYVQRNLHPELRLPRTGDRFPGVSAERMAPYLRLTTDEAIVGSAERLPAVTTPAELAAILDQHVGARLGGAGGAAPRRLLILGERHNSPAALIQALLGMTSLGQDTLLLVEQRGQKQADQVHRAGKHYLRQRAKKADMSSRLGELIKNDKFDGHLMALGALAEVAHIEVRPFDPLYGSGKDLLTREQAMQESIKGALGDAGRRRVVVLCGMFHVGPIHEYFTREEFHADTLVAAAAQIDPDLLEGPLAPLHLRERCSYVLSHSDVLAWRPTDELETTLLDVDALLAARGVELSIPERRSRTGLSLFARGSGSRAPSSNT